ncbi:hypothetical protein HMN09_01003100 [Mycena chlorophos]|uniref:Uncharacterized protein n=1 Tax=Mycena chlorophos TaxID=658473 RepID=A0A8H6SKG3_MYCCL|nr:hypothetical protein HMN09_01003100 [Mycena chlorophos]
MSPLQNISNDPAVQAAIQATIHRLDAEVARCSDGTKKSASDGDSNSSTNHDTLRTSGRRMVYDISPFLEIYPLVQSWATRKLLEEINGPTIVTDPKLQEELDFEDQVVDAIGRHIPGFAKDMLMLGGKNSTRKAVCANIQSGLRGARSDDSDTLNKGVCRLINRFYGPTLPTPGAPAADTNAVATNIVALSTKLNRGFVNPITAHFLCPMKYTNNPETIQCIVDGEYEVNEGMLFTGLYGPGTQYNSNYLLEGLLKNPLLFALVKHLVHGPSSVDKGPGATSRRAGKGALAGMTELTPLALAYFLVQYRFTLANHTWAKIDGNFNYVRFYGQREQGHPGGIQLVPSDFDKIAEERAAKRWRVRDADMEQALASMRPLPTFPMGNFDVNGGNGAGFSDAGVGGGFSGGFSFGAFGLGSGGSAM